MANINELFQKFNGKITLTSSKKNNLRIGRNALRKKIKDSFKDEGRNIPTFCGQGSYMMKTIINPLEGGEYDIDDGVYLQGYSDTADEGWPSTYEVHDWIYDAVDGHTSTPPEDKDTCIRVIYAGDYHIDLPCYIMKNDVAYLAHKTEGWTESDPKAFTKWFQNELGDKGEQVRSLVKYLKAWKDFKEIDLKGIACTILICENFYAYENRDDKSLLGTLTNIVDALDDAFECKKPVMPYEDLFEDYGCFDKNELLNALEELQSSLDNAINEEDEEKASEYMIEQFGERFPKGSPTTKDNNSRNMSYIRTEAPGVLHNDGRSA